MIKDFQKPKQKYRAFRVYWKAYGGLSSLLDSQWLWFAIILTGVSFPLWLEQAEEGGFAWLSLIFSSMPSLLGFSIGALSILVGFSSLQRDSLHKIRGTASYYRKLISSFFHFILIQFSSLIFALICMSYPSEFLSGLTFFFFSYALLSGIAAVAMIVGLASLYDRSQQFKAEMRSSNK